MTAEIQDLADRRAERQSELWERYRVAALRAQQTLTLEDARAAGEAWRDFVCEFLPREQRRLLLTPARFERRRREVQS